MDSREALVLADCNLAEATREMARWHHSAELWETGDALYVAGVDAFPAGYGNAAMALGPDAPADAGALLAEADAFFAARGRGFTLWTRAHLDADLAAAAGAAGLRPLASMPGMLLEAPLADAPPPEGARLALARDAAGVRDFASVSARAYAPLGMPSEVCGHIFSMPERLLRPHVLSVVAYLDGAPVSAAQAILSHGVAGIYWVGSTPEARKRGLGEACTRLVGNAAFERGARCVVLQASQQGEPIYRRMGYREITRYAWWLRLPGGA
jgi:ribosomal protein S18 acetylase RimI-like enzyme